MKSKNLSFRTNIVPNFTGVFNVVSLALFVIGSFALNVPEDLHLKDETKGINYKDLTIGGKKWVVLVAGSSEWVNYRHQVNETFFISTLWLAY